MHDVPAAVFGQNRAQLLPGHAVLQDACLDGPAGVCDLLAYVEQGLPFTALVQGAFSGGEAEEAQDAKAPGREWRTARARGLVRLVRLVRLARPPPPPRARGACPGPPPGPPAACLRRRRAPAGRTSDLRRHAAQSPARSPDFPRPGRRLPGPARAARSSDRSPW